MTDPPPIQPSRRFWQSRVLAFAALAVLALGGVVAGAIAFFGHRPSTSTSTPALRSSLSPTPEPAQGFPSFVKASDWAITGPINVDPNGMWGANATGTATSVFVLPEPPAGHLQDGAQEISILFDRVPTGTLKIGIRPRGSTDDGIIIASFKNGQVSYGVPSNVQTSPTGTMAKNLNFTVDRTNGEVRIDNPGVGAIPPKRFYGVKGPVAQFSGPLEVYVIAEGSTFKMKSNSVAHEVGPGAVLPIAYTYPPMGTGAVVVDVQADLVVPVPAVTTPETAVSARTPGPDMSPV